MPQPTLCVEPRTGDWLRSTEYGRQVVLAWPAAAGAELPVANIDNLPGPPRVRTIALSRSDFRSASVPSNANVRARVAYGVGGTYNILECDWRAGAQLSVVASTIRVSAVVYQPYLNAAYNVAGAPPIELGAAFGDRGPIAHGRPNTYTASTRIVPAGATQTLDLPDLATEFVLQLNNNADPATAQSVFLRFDQAPAGVQIVRYDAQVCAGARSVLIPGNATRVAIENTLGAGVLVTPQFILGL